LALAIDLIIAAIVAFCAWRGFKSGIVRGVFGVLALVVALFAANIAATAYSDEFTGMLKPFVGGIVDSAFSDILLDEEGQSIFDVGESGAQGMAFSALRRIGLPVSSAERVAEQSVEEGAGRGGLAGAVTDRLSSALAYAAVFGIAFLLLAIIFAVVGNLINLVFSLPGLRLVDAVAGVAFGLAKGLLIIYAIAAIIRYIGLLAPETLEATTLLNHIVNNNPIANFFGI